MDLCGLPESRGFFGQFFLALVQSYKGNEKKEEKGEEQGMSIHPVVSAYTLVLGDPLCNSPIEAHQGPASFLLSSSEPQSPGGSGLEDTDSDNDIRMISGWPNVGLWQLK